MTKKVEKLSKEYLEEKLKVFLDQKEKLEDRLDEYTQLWQKLEGAIITVSEMLEEFKEPEVDE